MKGARLPQPAYSLEGRTISKGNTSITFVNPYDVVVPKDVPVNMVNLIAHGSHLENSKMFFSWATPTEIVIHGIRLVLLSDTTKGVRRVLEYQVCGPNVKTTGPSMT